jgi:hypothetical protein
LKEYVDALERSPDRERQRALLERIIDRPREHARLINTFARMEYVGVRKMLKSRRSEALDLDGLQHILDETVHALRLKKAALAVASSAGGVGVETFATKDTLAGDAGEDYLQDVDHAAEAVLTDLPEAKRAESNYVLSSAAIEVRAQAFYPLYEQCLRAREVPMSVAMIMKDEDRHLTEMGDRLASLLPDWRFRLGRVLVAEQRIFEAFMQAVATAVDAAGVAASTAARAPAEIALPRQAQDPLVLAVRHQ